MMERLQFDSKRSSRKFLALLIELKNPGQTSVAAILSIISYYNNKKKIQAPKKIESPTFLS